MPVIEHVGSCNAPVDVAFAYLDDYRTATEWMFGLTEFRPVGDLDHGVGATFEAAFALRPVRLRSTVQVTEWEQDRVIGVTSIKGFVNASRWCFHADGPARTSVEVRFEYELPGGLAGRALGRMLEPVVALSVRQSDHALRRAVETRSG